MKKLTIISFVGLFLVGMGLTMSCQHPAAQAAQATALDTLEASTPQQALVKLMAGNERYAGGQCIHPRTDMARVSETVPHQAPFAAVAR